MPGGAQKKNSRAKKASGGKKAGNGAEMSLGSGKYAKVTFDQLCNQVDELTQWVVALKSAANLAGQKLPPGPPRTDPSGSPPPFP